MRITDKMRLNRLLDFLNSEHCVYSNRKWSASIIDAAIYFESTGAKYEAHTRKINAAALRASRKEKSK